MNYGILERGRRDCVCDRREKGDEVMLRMHG